MDEQPKKKQLPAEIAAWYGTGAIVLAYVLVSFNILPAGGGCLSVT